MNRDQLSDYLKHYDAIKGEGRKLWGHRCNGIRLLQGVVDQDKKLNPGLKKPLNEFIFIEVQKRYRRLEKKGFKRGYTELPDRSTNIIYTSIADGLCKEKRFDPKEYIAQQGSSQVEYRHSLFFYTQRPLKNAKTSDGEDIDLEQLRDYFITRDGYILHFENELFPLLNERKQLYNPHDAARALAEEDIEDITARYNYLYPHQGKNIELELEEGNDAAELGGSDDDDHQSLVPAVMAHDSPINNAKSRKRGATLGELIAARRNPDDVERESAKAQREQRNSLRSGSIISGMGAS